MPLTASPFAIRISPILKDVINAMFTDVVGPGSLAILDKSKVSPRYKVLFWTSTVITTGASADWEKATPHSKTSGNALSARVFFTIHLLMGRNAGFHGCF